MNQIFHHFDGNLSKVLYLSPKRILEGRGRVSDKSPVSVSSGSAERSFSRMKLIKNDLRSSMEDDPLTNLMALSLCRNIKIDHNQVIDKFPAKKRRKLSVEKKSPEEIDYKKAIQRHLGQFNHLRNMLTYLLFFFSVNKFELRK